MKPSQNKRLVFGSLLLIGAFAILIAGSMRSSTLRAIPVGELRAADSSQESHVGQRLRVVGFVGHEPVQKVTDPSTRSEGGAGSVQHFLVHEEKQTLAVEYRDALPETFKAGLPVQVDGVYYAPGKLRADRVLTKCPSKYQAEEVEKATAEREIAVPQPTTERPVRTSKLISNPS